MAEFQETVQLTDRKYSRHAYKIAIWPKNKKVDLYTIVEGQSLALKMSKAEAEELIVRLQFAVHALENSDE